jgi:hypothetical protein
VNTLIFDQRNNIHIDLVYPTTLFCYAWLLLPLILGALVRLTAKCTFYSLFCLSIFFFAPQSHNRWFCITYRLAVIVVLLHLFIIGHSLLSISLSLSLSLGCHIWYVSLVKFGPIPFRSSPFVPAHFGHEAMQKIICFWVTTSYIHIRGYTAWVVPISCHFEQPHCSAPLLTCIHMRFLTISVTDNWHCEKITKPQWNFYCNALHISICI